MDGVVSLADGAPQAAPAAQAMEKSKFREELIAHALRLYETGVPAVDVCR